MVIKITYCCQNFEMCDEWGPVNSENMRKVIKSDNFLVKPWDDKYLLWLLINLVQGILLQPKIFYEQWHKEIF